MTRSKMVGVAVLSLLAAACPHDVRARYPVDEGMEAQESATLVLQFTGAVEDAHVSVNGKLVASDEHTRRIVVEGIPPGQTSVVVAAAGVMEKMFVVDLQPGQRVEVPLTAVDVSVGKTVLQALLTAAVYAAYFALAGL